MTAPRLTAGDQALVAEIIGYLRGIAAGHNSDEKAHDWPLILSSRLRDLERKLWPLE
jgi:hypothetical protein